MAKQMEFMLDKGVEGIPLPHPADWTAKYKKAELLYLDGPMITFGPSGGWSYPDWLKDVIQPVKLLMKRR